MKTITVYSGPFCNFCEAAKRLLQRNNLTFKEIDISAEASADISISLNVKLFLCNNLFAASQKLQKGPE